MSKLFVDRVIQELERGDYHRSEYSWKPQIGDLIFCSNYNHKFVFEKDAWNVVVHEGLVFYRVKLERDNFEVPLTRDEKKRLTAAYLSAIRGEQAKWKARKERSRYV